MNEIKTVCYAVFETNSVLTRVNNLYWSQKSLNCFILTCSKNQNNRKISVSAPVLANHRLLQMVDCNAFAFYQEELHKRC